MKDKIIEEMAKVNHEKCSFCDTCDNCKYQWHEDCEKIKYATNIYNAGYRKLPEDSVVLSKEEYYELKQAKKLLEIKNEEINNLADANIRYSIALENKSKETAEKVVMDFYYELFEAPNGRVITYDSFCKIAQKHNIEIPRETFTLTELEAKHEDVEIKEN